MEDIITNTMLLTYISAICFLYLSNISGTKIQAKEEWTRNSVLLDRRRTIQHKRFGHGTHPSRTDGRCSDNNSSWWQVCDVQNCNRIWHHPMACKRDKTADDVWQCAGRWIYILWEAFPSSASQPSQTSRHDPISPSLPLLFLHSVQVHYLPTDKKWLSYNAFCNIVAKNRNLALKDVFAKQLIQIGKVTPERAAAIVKAYPTPMFLQKKYPHTIH